MDGRVTRITATGFSLWEEEFSPHQFKWIRLDKKQEGKLHLLRIWLGGVLTLLGTALFVVILGGAFNFILLFAILAPTALGAPDVPKPNFRWIGTVLWATLLGIVIFSGVLLLVGILPRKKMEGKEVLIQLHPDEVYRL